MRGSGRLRRATFELVDLVRYDTGVEARNLQDVPTEATKIGDVPGDAMPPREPGDPVAPVGAVPRTDPPVH